MRYYITILIMVFGYSAMGQCDLGSFSMNNPTGITTTSVNLSWGTAAEAINYKVQRSTNGGSSYTDVTTTTSTSYTVTGLTAGTDYVFRIEAWTLCFTGPPHEPIQQEQARYSSNTKSVTTRPNAPVVNSASSIGTTSFTARWFTTTGADSYELDVSTSSSFSSYVPGYEDLAVSGSTTTTRSVTGLTPGVNYYYRVRAKNSGGTSSNSGTSSLETDPNTPVILAPSDITGDSFTARWSSATGADDYRLYVSTSSIFSSHLAGYNGAVVTGTSEGISDLTAGETYYYRVRAANTSDVLSSYSSGSSADLIPNAPVIAGPTDIGRTEFRANWSDVSGEDNYLLDVSKASDFSSFVDGYESFSVTGNSELVTGLDPGEVHYYRVRAENSGGISDYSGSEDALLIPADPTSIAVGSVTQSAYTLSWDAMTGATGYLLDVSVNADFSDFISGYEQKSITTTSETIEGLTAGIVYYSRISSTNASGTSNNTSAPDALLVPPDPTIEGASNIGQTDFSANWSTTTGAADYLLDVSQEPDFGSFVDGYEQKVVEGNTTTVTGINTGERYYYRVSARNSGGTSGLSGSANVLTIPGNPESVSISEVTQAEFTINWALETGATSYFLDVSLEEDFSSFIDGYNGATITGTSATVSNLEAGLIYYTRIRAQNGSGISGNSTTETAFLIPPDPQIPTLSDASQTSFVVSWGEVTGATMYFLDVSLSEAFDEFVEGYEQKEIDGVSETVTGLLPGKSYYARLSAGNSSGSSGLSNSSSIQLIGDDPGVMLVSNITQTSFELTWSSVEGAEDYLLDVSENNAFSSFLEGYNNKVISNLSESISDLMPGNTYYARIRSRNGSGISGYSSTSSSLLVSDEPSLNTATQVTQESLRISWNSVEGASSYLLDASLSADFSTFLEGYEQKEIIGTEEVISGLLAGELYHFRLMARNVSGNSGYSNIVTQQLIPENPGTLSISQISQSGFLVSWNAVLGADQYELDVARDEAFTDYLDGYNSKETTDVQDQVDNLETGTIYYVRLRSENAIGESNNSSVYSVITIPDNPTSLTSSNLQQEAFTVRWDQMEGTENYLLEVSLSQAFEEMIEGYQPKVLSDTSDVILELDGGQTYFVRVSAENESGISGYSEILEVLLIPSNPNAAAVSNVSQTGFDLSWPAMQGATNYLLDISGNSDFTSFESGYEQKSITGISEEVTGLLPGTQYFVRYRAQNETGLSDFSAIVSVILIPAEPNTLAATAVSQTEFTANWESVKGVDAYLFDVSQEADFSELEEGYDGKLLTSTEEVVSELIPGNRYYYRVRAQNGSGVSGNSNTTQVLLIPDDPEGLQITDLQESSLQISWSAVNGADRYFLDVATDPLFELIVPAFDALETSESEFVITELDPARDYYIRLRAGNETGASFYSDEVSGLTLPALPAGFNKKDAQPTGFTVFWDRISEQKIDRYAITVSEKTTGEAVPGFDPVIVDPIPANAEFPITGLLPSTVYDVSMVAINASGSSQEAIIFAQTANQSGELEVTEITDVSIASSQLSASVKKGLTDIQSVVLFHKKVTAPEFESSVPLVLENGEYVVDVQEDWKDILGWEYRVEVQDGSSVTSESGVSYREPGIMELDHVNTFGTEPQHYRMISIPYEIEGDSKIGEIIGLQLGEYDKTKWRFVRYEGGANKDYLDGLQFDNFKRGSSYWIISSKPVDLNLGVGLINDDMVQNTTIQLEAGYNQIANPFPFTINWSDILEINGITDEVSADHLVYNAENRTLDINNEMLPYQGGFVSARSAITLDVPVSLINGIDEGSGESGGRIAADESAWLLPLSIKQGKVHSKLTGIGMHENATDQLDRMDLETPPGFAQFSHLYSYRDQEKLSRDIVNHHDEFTWELQLENSGHDRWLELSWPLGIVDEHASMFLYVPESQQLVDMMVTKTVRIPAGVSSVQVYFSKSSSPFGSVNENMVLGSAYPNPSDGRVTIPFHFSFQNKPGLQAELIVHDHAGKQVFQADFTEFTKGVNTIQWEGENETGQNVSAGIYFYRVSYSVEGHNYAQQGKILIRR